MHLPVFFAALGLLAATPTVTEAPPPEPWVESGSVATGAKAGITVPLSAGTLEKVELNQFGDEGIDLYAKYETPDRAIFGTIFLYAPTLPDTGLTFLATDEVIRRRLGAPTHVAADELVPVAGVKGAGRRVIYEGGEKGQLVSTATFVRAGSWIAIGRASGPAARAAEIKANLDALIAGMSFPKGSEPLPAKVVRSEPCLPRDRTPEAKITKPSVGEAAAFALMSEPGIVDEKGHSALNPFREAPDKLCLESIELNGAVATQIFRAEGKSGLPFAPRLYVLAGDAGVMIEVSESMKEPGTFYLLRHGVGRMYVFGKLDREPSIAQIRGLIAHPSEQPAFALFTSRLIAADGHDNLNLYCNQTSEGCADSKAAKPKP